MLPLPSLPERIRQMLRKTSLSWLVFRRAAGARRDPREGSADSRVAGVQPQQGLCCGLGPYHDPPSSKHDKKPRFIFFLACNILKYSDFSNLWKLTCDYR